MYSFPKAVTITRGLVLSWALNCKCDTSQRYKISRGQSHLLVCLPKNNLSFYAGTFLRLTTPVTKDQGVHKERESSS